MARITVLAGTNGAGKSSVGGAFLRAHGAEYYNPDEATRRILQTHPDMTVEVANSLAWKEGVRQLLAAIEHDHDYAFETTLGGRTVTRHLQHAVRQGIRVCIWYVALDSPKHHLARIRARVAAGGHDIPEARVRARYTASRRNLITLMPDLDMLRVFDNSTDVDPAKGQSPQPRLLLSVDQGRIQWPRDVSTMAQTPEWAKPVVAHAFALARDTDMGSRLP